MKGAALILVLAVLAVIWLLDALKVPAVCPRCAGKGETGTGGGPLVPGKRVVKCLQCRGTGRTSRLTGRRRPKA